MVINILAFTFNLLFHKDCNLPAYTYDENALLSNGGIQ
jgi:hypothetical protein